MLSKCNAPICHLGSPLSDSKKQGWRGILSQNKVVLLSTAIPNSRVMGGSDECPGLQQLCTHHTIVEKWFWLLSCYLDTHILLWSWSWIFRLLRNLWAVFCRLGYPTSSGFSGAETELRMQVALWGHTCESKGEEAGLGKGCYCQTVLTTSLSAQQEALEQEQEFFIREVQHWAWRVESHTTALLCLWLEGPGSVWSQLKNWGCAWGRAVAGSN